ncbi:MAG: hypothetical protein UR28_C0042G0024 [Candidatus Peregrinibacteria bacterium GW2011_GWF2_33_10]|nr:MAG: hypothetical protein UR28_C0042G0024 [Candidatus Peregrinibacteria bacterium GW2011_GWF2_33_10]OGJ45676.1 MAG: hypothetical protein A2263_01805 [Candidatus Peregrinibacteria bacterium RIFOXYA2_FULL_33_21]
MKQIEKYFNLDPNIILPGIDLKMVLPVNTLFRYDGEVPSLEQNFIRTELAIQGICDADRSLLRRILEYPMDMMCVVAIKDLLRKKGLDLDSLEAYCYKHQIDRRTVAYVLAKKKLERSNSIFADGHESGEFLDEIDRKDALQNIIIEEGINLDTTQYEGEDFADLAGLLALRLALKRGEQGITLPVFTVRRKMLDSFGQLFLE